MRRSILSTLVDYEVTRIKRNGALEAAIAPPAPSPDVDPTMSIRAVTKPVDTSGWEEIDAKDLLKRIQKFRAQMQADSEDPEKAENLRVGIALGAIYNPDAVIKGRLGTIEHDVYRVVETEPVRPAIAPSGTEAGFTLWGPRTVMRDSQLGVVARDLFGTHAKSEQEQPDDMEFDIPGLDGIDERVDAMRSGGGEIVEDSGDGCEGGACKI